MCFSGAHFIGLTDKLYRPGEKQVSNVECIEVLLYIYRTYWRTYFIYIYVCVCVCMSILYICIYVYVYILIYILKFMATYSNILAWEIPWTEDCGWLTLHEGHKVSDKTERLHFHFSYIYIYM